MPHVSKPAATIAAALFASLAAAGPASADIISETFDVSGPNGGPFNPFVVDFSITFNNSGNIGQTTTGISLISAPFAPAGGFGFEYNAAHDELTIGGLANGVDNVTSGDFEVVLDSVSTAPSVLFWEYLASGAPAAFLGVESGTVTVPEPSSLALLGSGLVGLGLIRRRRKANQVASQSA